MSFMLFINEDYVDILVLTGPVTIIQVESLLQ